MFFQKHGERQVSALSLTCALTWDEEVKIVIKLLDCFQTFLAVIGSNPMGILSFAAISYSRHCR